MSVKSPDFWLETVVIDYPSDAPQDILRIAKNSMAWPTFIRGCVLKQNGWSKIDRALSDWKGNPKASTFTATADDSDGTIRALTSQIGRTAYAKVETSLKMLSRAGRIANLTPRILHRGFLQRGPQALQRCKVRINSVDAAGSTWSGLFPGSTLQKHFINREFLEACGVTGTPKDLIGKPYNIVVGEHTDDGQLDANGQPNAIGMIPVDELGSVVRTQTNEVPTEETFVTQIPPPVLSAVVVGPAGSETYHYAVSAITASGETVWSNIVTVTGAPHTSEMGVTRYVELTWTKPTGWDQVYFDHVIGFRVGGRSSNPPDTYLDLMHNDDEWKSEAQGGSPEYGYKDGAMPPLGAATRIDVDIEKAPPAPAVGTAVIITTSPGDPETVTTHTQWFLFCWAFSYCEMNKLYGAAVEFQHTEASRVLLDFDHPDLMTPKSAAWPHPNPWIDLDDGNGNILRISGFYARGFYADQHRTGSVTFAVSGCGVTPSADDTTEPITEASEAYIWMIDRLALTPDWNGADPWPALQLFSNGESILHTELIRAFQARTVDWIGGRGYQFHRCWTDRITVGQAEQEFNITFSTFTGDLDNGQRAVWLIDALADPSVARIYRQHIEIGNQPLPEGEEAIDEVENELSFKFDWNPDLQEFRGDANIIRNIDSQKMYGKKPVELELYCTRDRLTAENAMAWRLFHNRVAPYYQHIPTSMYGLEQDPGTMVRLVHDDGPYEAGFTGQMLFIVRKQIDPNRPEADVVLTGRIVREEELLASGEFLAEGNLMPFVMV